MGLVSFFKKRAYVKMVNPWHTLDLFPLSIMFPFFSINGLNFNSHIEDTFNCGKPSKISMTDNNTVLFEFWNSGFVLEFENEKLDYVGIVFIPDQNIPSWPQANPAVVSISGISPQLETLSNHTSFNIIKEVFGQPTDEDVDEYEKILNYSKHGNGHYRK